MRGGPVGDRVHEECLRPGLRDRGGDVVTLDGGQPHQVTGLVRGRCAWRRASRGDDPRVDRRGVQACLAQGRHQVRRRTHGHVVSARRQREQPGDQREDVAG